MVTKVLFIGNMISGDDGVAPIVLSRLRDDSRLSEIELIEAGVMGISVVPFAQGSDLVIFVDAIRAPLPPGTVTLVDQEHIQDVARISSAHDVGVEQVITMLQTLSSQTRTSIIGIVVEDVSPFTEKLSPVIEGSLDTITEDVAEHILMLAGGSPDA